MRKFEIEFTVHQQISYEMTVEAETPEQAIELASDPDYDRHDAEEETLLESWDDTDTIAVIGERIDDGDNTSHFERFDTPVTAKPTPFAIYRESRGNRCPQCDSEHIVAHPFEADDMIAWREVECTNCETFWKEQFNMINIDLTMEDEGKFAYIKP